MELLEVDDNYNIKKESYFQNVRMEIVELIPSNAKSVLEIGSGTGATLNYIKLNTDVDYTVGYDISTSAYESIDEFYTTDLNKIDNFGDRKFDVVLCLDVLEHLQNPTKILNDLKSTMSENSKLIVSLPNFCFYQVINSLVFRANFKQEDEGVFDKTHIHNYCLKNMTELLTEAGYKVEKVRSPLDTKYRDKNKPVGLFNRLTFGVFKGYLSSQFFLICTI